MDGKPHVFNSGWSTVGRSQGGMALLAATVAVGLFAVVAMLGYSAKTLYDHRLQVDTRAQLLDEGERALLGFLAEHHRLPCPDLDGDGEEDCEPCADTPEDEECAHDPGIPAKGLLPANTVQLDLAGYRPGLVRLGYVVDPRLAEQVQRFRAGRWDYWQNADMEDLDKTFARADGVNVLDFCAALDEVRHDGSQAFVRDIENTTDLPVAFGLADPGETLTPAADDSGNRFRGFEGHNADWQNARLESPLRAGGPGYDDQVSARGAQALFDALSCQDAMASLHAIGQAVEVVAEVESQKVWTTVIAGVKALVAAVKTAVLVAKGILVVSTALAAKGELAQAIVKLKAAIGSCAALVGCAAIPVMAAAVAAATAAVAAAIAAVGFYVAAIPPQLVAVGLYVSVAIESGAALADSDVDWDEMLAIMKDAADDADEDAREAREDANEAREEANDAWGDYRDSREALETFVIDTKPDDVSDADARERVSRLYDRYRAYMDAEQAVNEAEAEKEQADEQVDKLEDALDEAQESLEDAPDTDGEIDPDNEDTWINRERLEASIKELEEQLAEARNEQSAAADQISAAKSTRDSAYSAYISERDSLAAWVGISGWLFDSFMQSYQDWYLKDLHADEMESAADQAEQEARELRDAYEDLLAKRDNPEDPEGEEIGVWDGAEDILNEALKRGAIQ
ncbi:MAG: hypothetical protein ACOC00_03150 [Halothiobacillaceae bacterium]